MNLYKPAPHNQILGWEDILLEHIGYKEDGFFVEVGAFDGIQWSPCRPLAVAGWDGVFFEPLRRPFLKLRKNYKDMQNIACINKAISDFVGMAEMFVGGSISTLEEDVRDLYVTIPEFSKTGLRKGKTAIVNVSILDLELVGLTACLDSDHIDVVSIDVEGSEMKVLRGFSLDMWKPTLVVVEAYEKFSDSRLSRKALEINNHMFSHSYEKIYSDHINNIYRRS